ncbi:hypothetical protein H1R20_g1145, partial [Candolleomyces eurysporus]
MKQFSFSFSLTVALPLLSVILPLPLLCSGKPTATLHNIERYTGEKTDRLIVTLHDGVKREAIASRLRGVYAEWDGVFNGFSGAFDEATITALRNSSDVKAIEEDGIFHVAALVTHVSGLNWVLNQHRGSGRPSVVAFPITGSANTALDNAVTSLTNNGIHVVVAAGNGNVDIRNISPARVPSVISVGATNIQDARTNTSNYGASITTFAPGQNSISSSNSSNTATNVLSGTSVGTAHVAGLVAYFIRLVGNMSPSAMIAKVKEDSVIDFLSNIRNAESTHHKLIRL